MMTREAPITNVAVDGENRIVSLLWTGGAPVRRYDWWNDRYYIEELSLEPEHVRMGRLQSGRAPLCDTHYTRSEEHTSELQSLMRISYAVFCLKKKMKVQNTHYNDTHTTSHI